MKYRPILFSGETVRAILDGRKTQTRRVVKPSQYMLKYTQDKFGGFDSHAEANDAAGLAAQVCLNQGSYEPCPYGQPGDRLWVREAWAHYDLWTPGPDGYGRICYKADDDERDEHPVYGKDGWRSPIFMPRWASRITLEVTGVRVERMQDISEEDAKAEGVYIDRWDEYTSTDAECRFATKLFAKLWDSINAKRGFAWDTNPFVWVVSFKKVEVSE